MTQEQRTKAEYAVLKRDLLNDGISEGKLEKFSELHMAVEKSNATVEDKKSVILVPANEDGAVGKEYQEILEYPAIGGTVNWTQNIMPKGDLHSARVTLSGGDTGETQLCDIYISYMSGGIDKSPEAIMDMGEYGEVVTAIENFTSDWGNFAQNCLSYTAKTFPNECRLGTLCTILNTIVVLLSNGIESWGTATFSVLDEVTTVKYNGKTYKVIEWEEMVDSHETGE